MTARAALRAATDAAHQRVDAYFSRLDLADPDDYARFLLAQASAFFPVEQALDEAGASLVIPDWEIRRRSTLLLADLEALGLTPPAPCEPPAYDTEAAIWGGAYVLEGSRLGGALLKRDVPGKMPRTFLDAPSPTAGGTSSLILNEISFPTFNGIWRGKRQSRRSLASCRPARPWKMNELRTTAPSRSHQL